MLRSITTAALISLLPCFADEGAKKATPPETSVVQDVTPLKAQALLDSDHPPLLIDIRTLSEFRKGSLMGAQLIDFRKDFATQLAKLDRDKTYLFHCQSGGRSTAAIPVWDELGFKKVYHLKTGYLGWQKADLPIVTGPPQETK